MGDGNPVPEIIIILLLVLFNAVIVNAKTAISNVNENSVKKKAEGGQKSAKQLLQIIDRPSRFVNVMDLLQSFIGVVIGMTFSSAFLPKIDTLIINSGIEANMSVLRPVYMIFGTVLLVYIVVLFGIILPRRFATKYAGTIAYRFVGIIKFLGFIFYPIAWLLEKLLNLLLRLFGIKPFDLTDNVTEEEIISMVNEGQEQGVLDAGEVEMISNIIELGEKEAQDIMTPKKRIIAVNAETTLEEALNFMLSEKYSRYPLYEGNRDNIIGVLHMKDIISAYISEDLKCKPLSEIAREPYFVPDTQNINMLFHDMQSKNIHMAIVIDEYGQTAGLVALEDFLEEIVGNIQDEYDVDESNIISVEEDYVTVKGSISLEELEDELDIRLHNEDFDTLNGLLISIMDRIPQDGEQATLMYQGYQFDVLETSNKMTQRIKISKLQETEPENPEENN